MRSKLLRKLEHEKFHPDSSLGALGLGRLECRAYEALCRAGIATASEVCELTGIPTSHLYKSLNDLVSKGLVEIVASDPKRFRPSRPDVAIPRLVDESHRRIELSGRMALKELSAIYSSSRDGLEKLRTIFGARSISTTIREICQKTLKELDISVQSKLLFEQLNLPIWLESPLTKGVSISVLSSDLEVVESLKDRVEARYVDFVPPMLWLISDGTASLTVHPPSWREGASLVAVLVTDKKLCRSHLDYYRYIWTEHYRSTMSKLRARSMQEKY